MGELNCLRCQYRHDDNGNCTAAGGFCTAVPAAHCRLLREYLDTGLTPDQYENAKIIISSSLADGTPKADEDEHVAAEDVEKYQSIDREKTPAMYVPHLQQRQCYGEKDLEDRIFDVSMDLLSMKRTFNGKFYTTQRTLQDFSWMHGLQDIPFDFHDSGSTCVTYFGHDFVLNNSFQEGIIYFVKED